MDQSFGKKEAVLIELNGLELKAAQLRLIKTLNNTILQAITTDNEREYFNNSAEIIRLCASLIQQSNFKDTKIASNKQALEFSIDTLLEYMDKGLVVTYDC